VVVLVQQLQLSQLRSRGDEGGVRTAQQAVDVGIGIVALLHLSDDLLGVALDMQLADVLHPVARVGLVDQDSHHLGLLGLHLLGSQVTVHDLRDGAGLGSGDGGGHGRNAGRALGSGGISLLSGSANLSGETTQSQILGQMSQDDLLGVVSASQVAGQLVRSLELGDNVIHGQVGDASLGQGLHDSVTSIVHVCVPPTMIVFITQ